ncbi:MAG: hypothetical protein JWP97_6440 [Labilithrix sp.]|nr:hypothetical protein [Labilithrix sp.]
MAAEDLPRLLKEAAGLLKNDVKGAIAKLDAALALALGSGSEDDAAVVTEELARAWMRRRSPARALRFAQRATELAPEQRASWTTLAKTCELVATRITRADQQRRARALYRAAASAFRKAASMTKDPEDKRWLQELAGDAARQAKPPISA